MTARVYLVLVLLSLFYNAEAQNPIIKITVGTMSGCGDAVRFIRDQLVPTFDKYEEYLEVEFVPWGRSRVDNEQIICYFGDNDCWANRMQRCALNLLKGQQRKQVEFMACDFTVPLPGFGQRSYECAAAVGLNIVDVDHCVNNPQNDDLDEEARVASIEPIKIIDFIPYIVINGDINRSVHDQAYTRLSSVVCFLLAADPNSGVTGCTI